MSLGMRRRVRDGMLELGLRGGDCGGREDGGMGELGRSPYGTPDGFLMAFFPTLKRGANIHCAYGAGAGVLPAPLRLGAGECLNTFVKGFRIRRPGQKSMPQGLKPSSFCGLSARLKSCPDTSCGSGCNSRNRYRRVLALRAAPDAIPANSIATPFQNRSTEDSAEMGEAL